VNSEGESQASARILSLGRLLDLDEESTLQLWGEVWREVKGTEGGDHGNIRAFAKHGWGGVAFPAGLALSWKPSPSEAAPR